MKNQHVPFPVLALFFLFICFCVLLTPAEAKDGSPDTKVFTGTIQIMIHDDIDGTVAEHDYLMLESDKDNWLRMTYASPNDRVAHVKGGKTVSVSDVFGEVKVTGALVDNELHVQHIDLISSETKSLSSGAPGPGTKKIAAVLIGFSGKPFAYQNNEVRDAIFGEETRSMDAFYEEASFGEFDVVGIENPDGDVLGPFNLSYSGCDAAGGYTQAATAARDAAEAAGHPIDEYDKILHVFVVGGAGCPGGGVAGGRYANIFVDLRAMWDYGSHEMGHCFGLGHASSSKDCSTRSGNVVTYGGSCTHDEYGDMSDIMGGRNFMFCSYHMERLQWLPAANSKTVTRSERVILWAINRPISGTQSLYASSQSNKFHFEFRRKVGFDERIETGLVDGILVRHISGRNPHIIDMTPTNDFRDAALRVGSTFKDENLEVTTVEVNDQYAVVDVVIDGDPVSVHPNAGGDGVRLSERAYFAIKMNGTTQLIALPLVDAANVRDISIMSPSGQTVQKLENLKGNLVWNGVSRDGSKIRSGVYIMKFNCGSKAIARTTVITR
ncbi:MAG: hypothetical protein JXA71_03005 [Chitinispirillaceae bacterium]|nr:hypothetical protein [Chitinispirillaceae bacterium]